MSIDFLPCYRELRKTMITESCGNCFYSKPYPDDRRFIDCMVNRDNNKGDEHIKLEIKTSRCHLFEPSNDEIREGTTFDAAVRRFEKVTGVNPADGSLPAKKTSEYKPFFIAYLKECGFSSKTIAEALNTSIQSINKMIAIHYSQMDYPAVAVYGIKSYKKAR